MASKIGDITMPNTARTKYPVYWDPGSGQVKVAAEIAGTARTKQEALHVADYYASTHKRKYMKK